VYLDKLKGGVEGLRLCLILCLSARCTGKVRKGRGAEALPDSLTLMFAALTNYCRPISKRMVVRFLEYIPERADLASLFFSEDESNAFI